MAFNSLNSVNNFSLKCFAHLASFVICQLLQQLFDPLLQHIQSACMPYHYQLFINLFTFQYTDYHLPHIKPTVQSWLNIEVMQTTQIEQKLIQNAAQIDLNTHSKIHQDKHSSIKQALIRFKQLNDQYIIQAATDLLGEKDDHKGILAHNKKVDNFTIMAKLRHLENTALLNRAQHQIGEREKKKVSSPNKSTRKKRKWLKYQNTLNQPYLKTYTNFLKSQKQQEDVILKHYMYGNQTPDLQSQSEISQDGQPFRKWLNFSKQLKPYRKIVSYTKKKVQMKNQYKNQCPIQKKKTQSLYELRSATHHKAFQQYSQIQKKMATNNQVMIRINKQNLAQELFQKKMSKIYKSKTKSQNNSYQKKQHIEIYPKSLSKTKNLNQAFNIQNQRVIKRKKMNEVVQMIPSAVKSNTIYLKNKSSQFISRSVNLRQKR